MYAFKRRAFLGAGIAAGALPFFAKAGGTPQGRPNILYIFTDQQSATMLSCAGNPWLRTPAMDYLAAHGTRFERAYCTNPVCVPSRIGMATGHLPGEFGARENEGGVRIKQIPADVQRNTIGDVIGASGYECAYAGKVHLPRPLLPQAHGFNVLTSNERDELAQAAADFLRKPRDKPFFLVASFINPHDICYMAISGGPKAVLEKSGSGKKGGGALAVLKQEMAMPAGVDEKEFFAKLCPPLPPNFEPQIGEPKAIEWLLHERSFREKARENFTERDWRIHRWAYHRLTERVDRQIQVVLDALRESGQEENTVVIFSSDHGDMDSSHRMEHKTALYEQAANVPMIVMHKGTGPAGQVDRDHLVSNGLDLLPTLCDYAGAKPPAGLRGLSLRPLAEGRPPATWRKTLAVESEIGRMVVRDDGLKYILYDASGLEEQLLDLKKDPWETRDMAGLPEYAKAMKELRAEFNRWFPGIA